MDLPYPHPESCWDKLAQAQRLEPFSGGWTPGGGCWVGYGTIPQKQESQRRHSYCKQRNSLTLYLLLSPILPQHIPLVGAAQKPDDSSI